MQKTVKCLACLLTVFCSQTFAQIPVAGGQATKAPTPSNAMVNTVGELVHLEAQKALEEARKAAQAAAPAASPSAAPFANARPLVVMNTDTVELLGTYQRGGHIAADLAINGVVRQVEKGDSVGAYEVTGIAGNCVHLLDPKKSKLLRCVFVDNK